MTPTTRTDRAWSLIIVRRVFFKTNSLALYEFFVVVGNNQEKIQPILAPSSV